MIKSDTFMSLKANCSQKLFLRFWNDLAMKNLYTTYLYNFDLLPKKTNYFTAVAYIIIFFLMIVILCKSDVTLNDVNNHHTYA